MTEQYSAYQTLAAQAAITQQLRAASDTSQVGVRWGDYQHGKWGRGCFFSSSFFRFSSLCPKIWSVNTMSVAGAGDPGCTGSVCSAGSAGQSGTGKPSHSIQQKHKSSQKFEKPQENIVSQAAASSKGNMLGNMAMLQVRKWGRRLYIYIASRHGCHCLINP